MQSDFTKPVTGISHDGGVYMESVDVTLSVVDESAYWIFWTIDGSDPKNSSTIQSNYNSSATITLNEKAKLQYFSKDIYGNTEDTIAKNFEIILKPKNDAEVYNNYADLSTGEKIRFVVNKTFKQLTIKVISLNGSIVWETAAAPGQKIIDWDGYADNKLVQAGMYYVIFSGDNINIKRKLVIIK